MRGSLKTVSFSSLFEQCSSAVPLVFPARRSDVFIVVVVFFIVVDVVVVVVVVNLSFSLLLLYFAKDQAKRVFLTGLIS